jgi:hypothetical protein
MGCTHVSTLWASFFITLDQLLTPPFADGLYTCELFVGQFLYQFGPVAHATFG